MGSATKTEPVCEARTYQLFRRRACAKGGSHVSAGASGGARASVGVPGTAPNNESRAWGVGALSRLSGGVRALPGRATEVV